MKVIVIATRKQDAKPEDFAPHLDVEVKHALGMYRDENGARDLQPGGRKRRNSRARM